MASPVTPSRTGTPSRQGTPGSWKHPKFDEIMRRQDARAFSDRKLTQAIKNTAALGASFIVTYAFYSTNFIYSNLPRSDFFNTVYSAVSWSIILLRLLFVYNIFDAIVGTLRGPDMMVDIALTPDQRSSLSLPPTPGSAAVAETSHYVTPPRYNKSSPLPSPAARTPTTPTPTTPNRGIGVGMSGKPRVTAAGSPVGPGQNLLTSPGSFSPAPQFTSPSPLRPIGGLEKRHSFGSPMGQRQAIGQGSIMGNIQSNVSPSVVASGKWLFEQKNRRRDVF
ncbi:hypothetical protein ABW19_dt0206286 [Dactylella cylindrospora]|nr:hypothetical protein ABW19_dt0206286 [Dactylella cylindrospora]